MHIACEHVSQLQTHRFIFKSLYRRSWLTACVVASPCRYEFIPQVIFLNALFGYLCFLIILKWVTGSTADLYHIMIYMFLNPMDIDCGGKCTVNLMFWGQSFIQVRSRFPTVTSLGCRPRRRLWQAIAALHAWGWTLRCARNYACNTLRL